MFAGLTRASIANIEKGRQRVFLHQLYHFANFLKVDMRELLPEAETVQNVGLISEAEAAYLSKLKRLMTHATAPPHSHRRRT